MIKKNKRLKKPSYPLAVVRFSKDGRVTKIVKELPSDKELLEEGIIKRFFNIVRKKRNFTQPVRNKEKNLDFRIQEVLSGTRIKWNVELVEIFNEKWRFQDIKRTEYFEALKPEFDNIQREDKFLVFLDDNYQKPPFPRVRMRKGEKLVEKMKKIISTIPEIMKEIPDSILKRIDISRSYSFTVVKNPLGSPSRLMFPAGYISSGVSDSKLFMDTIKKKIERNYAIGPYQKIMLVSYSTQLPYSINSELRKEIKMINNTFDEIWYFYPFVERDRGFVEQIV